MDLFDLQVDVGRKKEKQEQTKGATILRLYSSDLSLVACHDSLVIQAIDKLPKMTRLVEFKQSADRSAQPGIVRAEERDELE